MKSLQEELTNIIVAYITSHPLINVNALEKALALPQATIGKALNGSRNISQKHLFPIICYLSSYGLKLFDFTLSYNPNDHLLSGRKTIDTLELIEEKLVFTYIVKEDRFSVSNILDLPFFSY